MTDRERNSAFSLELQGLSFYVCNMFLFKQGILDTFCYRDLILTWIINQLETHENYYKSLIIKGHFCHMNLGVASWPNLIQRLQFSACAVLSAHQFHLGKKSFPV